MNRCQKLTVVFQIQKAGNFELTAIAGSFVESQIIVMLGENGTGKTTFIRMLAGSKGCAPDNAVESPNMNVSSFLINIFNYDFVQISYKPQTIKPKFAGSVRQLLHTKIQRAYVHPQVLYSSMISRKLKSS